MEFVRQLHLFLYHKFSIPSFYLKQTKDKFPEYFKDVNVLEIGSLNINGTVRNLFESKNYVGIDLIGGKDVDIVANGCEFDSPDNTYDVIISTECFEHNKNFLETFLNMHRMVKQKGMVLFTCATEGRTEHGTSRTTPENSPATTDYYMNVNENHFITNLKLKNMFSRYSFEYNGHTSDLYFWGIKK